jgi:hypothetical protein
LFATATATATVLATSPIGTATGSASDTSPAVIATGAGAIIVVFVMDRVYTGSGPLFLLRCCVNERRCDPIQSRIGTFGILLGFRGGVDGLHERALVHENRRHTNS